MIGYWQNIQNIHINEFLIFFYFNVEKKEIFTVFKIKFNGLLDLIRKYLSLNITVNSMKSYGQ